MELVREAEGIQASFVMMVISKAEISKMAKNGGNNFGLKETDGSLLCEYCVGSNSNIGLIVEFRV